MSAKTFPAVYLCGGDTSPGRRDECPNPLHDWPLPSGYVDAAQVAASRLAHGWANTRCPDCGLYGWVQGRPTPRDDTRVTATREDPSHA